MEEPLPAGGSCLLGSINLAEFVINPYTSKSRFDTNSFLNTVDIAVKALNDVLDEGLPLLPLQEQKDSVGDWRQIGLGIFGLADMLIKMETKYGSEESIAICNIIANEMIQQAIYTSSALGGEYGSFLKIDKHVLDIVKTDFFKNTKMWEGVVRDNGLRNSQLLTIAPTGTLSSMLGVSSGIEPIYANSYTRKTESLHKEGDTYYKVYTPIVKEYMEKHNITDEEKLPDFFVTAQTLNYKDKIDMQAIWQKYIDASISSTVNLPYNTSIEDVEKLYLYAWEKGLKGITVFRDGCKRTGILTTDSTPTSEQTPTSETTDNPTVNTLNNTMFENTINYDTIIPTSRKKIGTTHGSTYCKKCACGTLYITINRDSNNNIVECFVHTSKGGICQASLNAINRMISLAMRSGVRIDEITDQLGGINCQACIKAKTKGDKIDGISCADILSKTIAEFYNQQPPQIHEPQQIQETNQMVQSVVDDIVNNIINNNSSTINIDSNFGSDNCPECGSQIKHESGCICCVSCGWSKCG